MCTLFSRLRQQKGIEEYTAKHTGVTSKVVITARGLFLNRYLMVSYSGGRVGGTDLFDWTSDTYVGALRLTPSVLEQWTGKRVIDVGCGFSLFSLEAELLGISVDRFDLNVDVERGKSVGIQIRELYCDQLALFSEANKDMKGFEGVFETVSNGANATLKKYFQVLENTMTGDATNMSNVAADTYDVAVTVYTLAYLNALQQESVIREMVRIVRPGGQIRLFPGATPNAISGEKFRGMFERDRRYCFKKYRVRGSYHSYSHGQFVIDDKVVTVDYSKSGQGLLILDVAVYDPYYFHTVSFGYKSAANDKQCVKCRAMHGFLPSVFNSWHECRNCGNTYCGRCGSSLGKPHFYSRERTCECGGTTTLI
jgi:SAM-dependent methyltransferase